MNKKTLTVAIAAYNAEHNIKKLLSSLIKQTEKQYELKRIVVYSDSSSDNTIKKAQEVEDLRLKVINANDRVGFAGAFKRIVELSKTEVLIVLNDDIIINDNYFLEEIMAHFSSDKQVGLVSAKIKPFSPKTFTESSVISGFNAYSNMASTYKNGSNPFTCDGKVIAMSKDFIKSIKFPKDLSQMGNVDSFIYLSAVVNGFKYLQSKKSIAYFRMPSNVKDFIKWQIRNNANLYALTKKFKNLPLTEYKKPFLLFNYFKLIELIKNPIGSVFVFFMGIYILSQTKKSAESFNITWDVISSTKNVTA